MYQAQIIADSLSPDGVRLTTFTVTFPRFILAELNTHRRFSRNSASSRAIPTEKIIEAVKVQPFVPETFNARVKGMGVGDPLEKRAMWNAKDAWLRARDEAVARAVELMNTGVDKSRVNRLLEPFMWHTAIISSTEWENFFAQRQPMNAEPVPQLDFPAQLEMQSAARLMRGLMDKFEPEALDYGQWHLPLVDEDELTQLCAARTGTPDLGISEEDKWKRVSASRCARVSYDRHHDDEEIGATLKRAGGLAEKFHMSPFEHVARPWSQHEQRVRRAAMQAAIDAAGTDAAAADSAIHALEYEGNFKGWHQMRKDFPCEDNMMGLI